MTEPITGAEIVLKSLSDQGVEVIFGAVEDCVASGISGDLCIDNNIWYEG